MNSIKCKQCGLSNFSSEVECLRCGNLLREPVKRGKRPARFSLPGILMITFLGALAYFIYNGAQASIEHVGANDVRRVAAQPTTQPGNGFPRSEADQRRAGHVGDAVKNSASLKAHQQHVNQTEKTMQQISNNQTAK